MPRIRIDRLSIRLPPGASRGAVEQAVTRALAADRRLGRAGAQRGDLARTVGGEVSRAVDARLPSARRR